MRTPLVAALAVTLPLIAAAPAEAAAPTVRFSYVQYNAKGADTRRNVNGEFLVITNYGSATVNLSGWTIGHARNLKDSKFTFYLPARRVYIKAKGSLVVRMGKGKNNTKTVYQGYPRHLWPNVKGQAYLFTPADKRVAGCVWNSTQGFTRC